MPEIKDFRGYSFSYNRLQACGKFLGKNYYWKLYTVENLLRIIIHSILSVQWTETSDWWTALAGKAKKVANENMKRYQPLDTRIFSSPGKHPLYFVYIKQLNEIIRTNKIFFEKVIPRLDRLILDSENLVIPRNIVAHMNYPSRTDQNRISVFYDDLCTILDIIIVEKKIELKIPGN